MASLQDQLMKAGLADEKAAKAIQKEKHKQRKQQPKGTAQVNETQARAQQARAEKAERDRQLNQQRQMEAERKAVRAQIRQLIDSNRIPRNKGESPYQFVHEKKIKKLFVDDAMVDQLSRGRLAVVSLDDQYDVVPEGVARKIMERDPAVVVALHERKQDDTATDDPYADYQIPDDLMW